MTELTPAEILDPVRCRDGFVPLCLTCGVTDQGISLAATRAKAGRRIEIFLDLLLAHMAQPTLNMLDERFQLEGRHQVHADLARLVPLDSEELGALFAGADLSLRRHLTHHVKRLLPSQTAALTSAAARDFRQLLESFGMPPEMLVKFPPESVVKIA